MEDKYLLKETSSFIVLNIEKFMFDDKPIGGD